MKKNAAFALISFAVLKWHECLSFQLPFELTVEIPDQLHLELEVNLPVHNVIEREIEREKVQMKPPKDYKEILTFYKNKLRLWFCCYILVLRKCLRKSLFQHKMPPSTHPCYLINLWLIKKERNEAKNILLTKTFENGWPKNTEFSNHHQKLSNSCQNFRKWF